MKQQHQQGGVREERRTAVAFRDEGEAATSLNRRLQQQQLHTPGAAYRPSGGGFGAGSDSGSRSGAQSSSSSQEQLCGMLQQQRQHRMMGEGSGGSGETSSSSFFMRAKPGSYPYLTSSGSTNMRNERHNRKDLPFGIAAGADASCPSSTAAPSGSACNLAARALVRERLLAMEVSSGESLQSKRPLTPGERPVYDFQGPEFQVEKRPKVMVADEKTVTRDRRMFGALAGHLRRAQQQLQREQGTDVAHKHKQQEERVAQKLALSQKNIAEIARLEWEERRQQERLRLEEVSMELVNKENELMRVHLVKHYKNMERFIGTEAQPTLFWLPAKWDDATRRLQEQTRLWIQTKIDHIQSTDYTYRPQQSCNGTSAAEEEGACSSAVVDGGESEIAAAGNSKAAEDPTERTDSKGREVRGRENSAGVSADTGPIGAAVADAVTPVSSVSPSTDSSTNAAVAVEGDATERHEACSSGVARSRAASKDAAAATAEAARGGEGVSGAVETVGSGGAGDTMVPEHEEDKSTARTGFPGLGMDTGDSTDETPGKNHIETATKNGSSFRRDKQ